MKNSMMMIFLIAAACGACKPGTKQEEEKKKDSVEQTELKKVDKMMQNQDSLIREEEKRLKEKYK